MEAIDIEAIQQELQKLGHERLEPNDPLFMDHLARRLELQWHHEKISELLQRHQNQSSSENTEYLECLRKSYSSWIDQGGNHLQHCVETAGGELINKLTRQSISPKCEYAWSSLLLASLTIVGFITGFITAWIVAHFV